jgi:hypothetical protein
MSEKKTFGTRCAELAQDLLHLPRVNIPKLAEIIDAERAALIERAKASSAPPPPPPTIGSAAASTPEDFGNRKKIPPTPEQITRYCAHIGYPINGQEVWDFYESKGWKIGDNRMKDWQAACRTWRSRGAGKLISNRTDTPPSSPRKF